MKTSFQPRVNFRTDKEGNLIGGEVQITDRRKEYFEELLNIKGTGSDGEKVPEVTVKQKSLKGAQMWNQK
jgi:hypothetical protein